MIEAYTELFAARRVLRRAQRDLELLHEHFPDLDDFALQARVREAWARLHCLEDREKYSRFAHRT